jgi:AraC-like DNA-binding protein
MAFVAPARHGIVDDLDSILRRLERDPGEALAIVAEELRPIHRDLSDWPDQLAVDIERCGKLQDFADFRRLHAAGLARRFRRLYGAAPAHLRKERRARYAIERIFGSDEPYCQIAYDLGFSDQAHMCREVRKLSGLSPGQWRRLKKFNTGGAATCHLQDMKRREFNAGAAALGAGLLVSGCAPARPTSSPATADPAVKTNWSVIESEAYDALCFWAGLAGDPEASRQYAAEVAAFTANFDARALGTIKAIYQQVAAAGNVLTHSACRFFSAGPHSTIDDLIQSARDIDNVLKPRHLADPEWEGEELWERYRQLMPPATMILEAMKAAGFAKFREDLYRRRYENRVQSVSTAVTPYNALAEARFLTGRSFQPNVEIALTYFSYPRSMRMLGQQFVTWAGYSDDIILNTSAHELMHPPLNLRGPAMQGAISRIFANGFFVAVVMKRDPSLGDVGDLPNYVEECMVQALDQIASERRSSPRRAVDFFSRSNGSDVLAACIYGLLKEDGYHRTGGNFEAWVAKAVADGRFGPESLEAAGTAVLGASPRTVWQPFRPAK